MIGSISAAEKIICKVNLTDLREIPFFVNLGGKNLIRDFSDDGRHVEVVYLEIITESQEYQH